MTKGSQAEPVETQYDDHKIIVPPHKLKTAIVHTSEPGDIAMDVVQKAEEALAQLKGEFGDWMQGECDQLDSARADIHKNGPNATNLLLLFRASHDIKGDAATLGYPVAGRLAGSLCRLVDHAPDRTRIPLVLVDRYVEAIRAVVREQVKDQADPMVSEITEQLAIMVEKYLAAELQDEYAEIAGEAYVRIDLPVHT
jgi:chemotaxis protein histidine kinase CheA